MNANKYKSIGEAMGYAIAKKGFTQSEYAEKFGYDTSIISRYVNNKITPRQKRLHKIGVTLGVRFLERDGHWYVIESSSDDLLNVVREKVTQYEVSELRRDDLPELLELRDKIQKEIDKLVS